MGLIFHPKFYSDLDSILEYYARAAGDEVADEFTTELWKWIAIVVKRPTSFSIRERDLRPVNLRQFPYHFYFRILEAGVQIVVVRHNRRNPTWGLRRR